MNERGIRHEEDLLLDFIYHYDRCHWGNKVQTLGAEIVVYREIRIVIESLIGA